MLLCSTFLHKNAKSENSDNTARCGQPCTCKCLLLRISQNCKQSGPSPEFLISLRTQNLQLGSRLSIAGKSSILPRSLPGLRHLRLAKFLRNSAGYSFFLPCTPPAPAWGIFPLSFYTSFFFQGGRKRYQKDRDKWGSSHFCCESEWGLRIWQKRGEKWTTNENRKTMYRNMYW